MALATNKNELIKIFKVLSNPVRLHIIQHLILTNSSTNTELVSKIPKAQSTISQHIKVLIDVGLVDAKTNGANSIYTLNTDKFNETVSLIQLFIRSVQNQFYTEN